MDLNELNELYQDTLLDHYKNPRGRKTIERCDVQKQGFNPLCGDRVTMCAAFKNDTLTDISVESKGCAISVASGSMLAELLPGKTIEEIERIAEAFREMMHGKEVPDDIDFGELDALEGVRKYSSRVKCAMLPWVTLKDMIRLWKQNSAPDNKPSTTEDTERYRSIRNS